MDRQTEKIISVLISKRQPARRPDGLWDVPSSDGTKTYTAGAFACTCPSRAQPCKHAGAVAYLSGDVEITPEFARQVFNAAYQNMVGVETLHPVLQAAIKCLPAEDITEDQNDDAMKAECERMRRPRSQRGKAKRFTM